MFIYILYWLDSFLIFFQSVLSHFDKFHFFVSIFLFSFFNLYVLSFMRIGFVYFLNDWILVPWNMFNRRIHGQIMSFLSSQILHVPLIMSGIFAQGYNLTEHG